MSATAIATRPSPLASVRIEPGTPALLVDEVSKVFSSRTGVFTRMRGGPKFSKRVVAVDHISLRIERGEIFGVLGRTVPARAPSSG